MKTELFQKHEAMLHDIEACVIDLYRKHSEVTDANVDLVYEALQRSFKAEANQRPAPTIKLSPLEQELFNSLKSICTSWMSVAPEPKRSFLQKPSQPEEPKTHEDLQGCLKMLRSSIRLWTKSFGRTGYLDYIGDFLPE
jgi:hypothetical protein